ncbi:rho GTPase-activating protein gacN-like [Hydra vulgaris]|uniref:Rho GTPase-activating protein gacN-like n=1 Tax=Hydra vulgaris TaxID=6087 RepID=A0ABM4BGQ5_HYDVU
MINESIYDWYLALKDTSYDAISCRYCVDFKVELFCCKKALAKKINRLVDTIRKLKKQRKNKKLALLLGKAFFPPVANFSDNTVNASEILKETILISENKMLKKKKKILKRKMESMMDLQMDYFTHLKDFEDMSNNLKILISKNSLIEAELNFIKKCYCEKEEKLNNIENKLELLKSKKESFNVRNLNKKIKYCDTQLEIKKNKINSLKNEEKKKILQLKNKIKDINSILENSDINISELKNEKIKLQKKVSNLKVILQNKTNYINDNNMKDVISLEKEVVSLYSKTNILKEENLELQKLVSLLDDDEVITFEDGRYSDDIRETIMKLLSMSVSMNSVNEVIKEVFHEKVGQACNPLSQIFFILCKNGHLYNIDYLAKF